MATFVSKKGQNSTFLPGFSVFLIFRLKNCAWKGFGRQKASQKIIKSSKVKITGKWGHKKNKLSKKCRIWGHFSFFFELCLFFFHFFLFWSMFVFFPLVCNKFLGCFLFFTTRFSLKFCLEKPPFLTFSLKITSF